MKLRFLLAFFIVSGIGFCFDHFLVETEFLKNVPKLSRYVLFFVAISAVLWTGWYGLSLTNASSARSLWIKIYLAGLLVLIVGALVNLFVQPLPYQSKRYSERLAALLISPIPLGVVYIFFGVLGRTGNSEHDDKQERT